MQYVIDIVTLRFSLEQVRDLRVSAKTVQD